MNPDELIVVETFYGILIMIRVNMWAENELCQGSGTLLVRLYKDNALILGHLLRVLT